MALSPHPTSIATSTSSSSRVRGDAAFRVLSNPQLFHLVSEWRTGWPSYLTQRWREIAAKVAQRQALPKWYRQSSERGVELFMRELLLAGDITTLRLASKCFWKDRDDGKLKRFRVTEPQFAVRSGHAETVQWALERYEPKRAPSPLSKNRYLVEWLWHEAITHFPGHGDVLAVLRNMLPVTKHQVAYARGVLGEAWRDVPSLSKKKGSSWFANVLSEKNLASLVGLAKKKGHPC